MAQYTLLQQEDINTIGHHYGLSSITFAPMAGGAGNSSYLLTTQKNKFVVTVFDDKSLEHVSRLANVLGHLGSNGFPTNRTVSPKDAGDAVMLYLDKPVLVKEYITGDARPSIANHLLAQVGAAMAQLHQFPAPDYLPQEHPYGKQLFPSVFDTTIDPEYETWLADRHKHLIHLLPTSLPTSLIHGDLFFDNVLFESDKLKALIDFEEACHYYRAFDIGMGIVGMCVEAGKVNLDKTKAFVSGYQQVQTLVDIEISALQLLVEYAAIATSYWRFWKYNIHTPMPAKKNFHHQMVEIANNVRAVPHEDFMDALSYQSTP